MIRAIVFIFALFPLSFAYAADERLVITEIMYAPEGTQAGREWLEIRNSGSAPVSFSEKVGTAYRWRIVKGSGEYPISPFGNNDTLQPGGFAIVAADPAKLLETDLTGFSGMIIKSSFGSLNDSGETLSIKDRSNDVIVDTVTYTPEWGAKKDGNSLQLIGSQWVAAFPTPGAPNSKQSASSFQDSSLSSSPSSASSSPSSSTVNIQAPAIKTYAGEDKTVAVGSAVSFLGSATGLDGKPLENARFWWNFGDGETAEGRSVGHIFMIPGEYTVGLHVSSGEYAASDYLKITVIPNQIAISGVVKGESGYLKIRNPSSVEIDIGGWIIEDAAGKRFSIPLKTKVGAGAEIALANSATGLFKEGLGRLTVYYPNLRRALEWSDSSEKTERLAASSSQEVIPTIPNKTKESKSFSSVPSSDVSTKAKNEARFSQQDNIAEEKAAASNTASSEFAQISRSGSTSLFLFLIAFGISLMVAVGFLVVRRYIA